MVISWLTLDLRSSLKNRVKSCLGCSSFQSLDESKSSLSCFCKTNLQEQLTTSEGRKNAPRHLIDLVLSHITAYRMMSCKYIFLCKQAYTQLSRKKVLSTFTSNFCTFQISSIFFPMNVTLPILYFSIKWEGERGRKKFKEVQF